MPSVLPTDLWLTPLLMTELVICSAIIAYADFRHMIIPNAINLVLLVGGLFYRARQGLDAAVLACILATVTFAAIWITRKIHFQATGRLGLGLGDVKLMTVAAIWLPFVLYPVFVFLAASVALVYALIVSGPNLSSNRRIPFGPFLSLSLTATWAFQTSFENILGIS